MSSERFDEAAGILTRAQERIDPILNADQRGRLQRMRDEPRRRLQEWFNIPEPQELGTIVEALARCLSYWFRWLI
jgi:hypothetical protein